MSKKLWKVLKAQLNAIKNNWSSVEEPDEISPENLIRSARIKKNKALLDVCQKITIKTESMKDVKGLSLSYKNGYHQAAQDMQFLILKQLDVEYKEETK